MNIKNKKIAITGTLSSKRSDIVAMIEKNGGEFSKSVTSNTDLLVRGTTKVCQNYMHSISGKEVVHNGEAKTSKAIKLGIPVISEADLIKTIH